MLAARIGHPIMLRRLKKLIGLAKANARFPGVQQVGAPPVTAFLGMERQTKPRGFYSQEGQDAYVFTEFFRCLESGAFPKIFLDVGCNHPVVHSNSYFFERNQGYEVIAIDALHEVGKLWAERRPKAQFFECAVGAQNGETSFDVVEGGGIESMFSSVSGASDKSAAAPVTKRTVKVRRLADIVSEIGLKRAGIVSMDIEGYEYQALQGLDLQSFSAAVFIIENNAHHGLGRDDIRDLMKDRGYVYAARIWNMDDIFVHRDALSANLAPASPWSAAA
jgi:FkbM family methyltransferase